MTKQNGIAHSHKTDCEVLIEKVLELLPIIVRGNYLKFKHHPNSEEIEETVQEIFLSLIENEYRKLSSFKTELSSLKTWLEAGVKNYFIDKERLKKDTQPIDNFSADDFSYAATQENEAIAKEQLRLFNQAIQKLTPEKREIIEAYCQDDDKTVELSHKLGITPENLRQKKHRIMAEIRAEIKAKTRRAKFS